MTDPMTTMTGIVAILAAFGVGFYHGREKGFRHGMECGKAHAAFMRFLDGVQERSEGANDA